MSTPWLAYVWTVDEMYRYNLQENEARTFIEECKHDPKVLDFMVFDNRGWIMHDESAHLGLLQTEYGDKL